MSTKVSKAVEAAANKLRAAAGRVSEEIDLRAIARSLNPNWESYLCLDEQLLLSHTDYCDGSPASVSTVAKFCKYNSERGMLAKQCLLAARAAWVDGTNVKRRYQLVMDVENPLERDVIARVDIETGIVTKGKAWLKVEENGKRVLTEEQLSGTVCAICGGDGASPGWLSRLAEKPLKCCNACACPSAEMVKCWLENSGAAVESGVAA